MLGRKRMRSLQVDVQGELPATSTAKDLILHIIARLGADGGRDCAIEFTGPAIRALSMEGRMTLCNMAIEAGARSWSGRCGRQDPGLCARPPLGTKRRGMGQGRAVLAHADQR